MTDQTRFDAIVIGGGHNGLSAAITLARKGKSVCVVERALHLGGMMAPEYGLAHVLYNLRPSVIRSLGLRVTTDPLETVALCPAGNHVVLKQGRATLTDGNPHPKAAEFARLHARLIRFAKLLEGIALHTPPKLSGGLTDPDTLSELIRLGKLGLGLKGMGKAEMQEFLRVLLTNVHDLMVDELGDGPLAGCLSADAVRGGFAGPYAPGTVFTLLYRLGAGGSVSIPRGGMTALTGAFEEAARRAGCTIRRGKGVSRVLVEGDRVQGVELDDGTVLSARSVLSSAGPALTMELAGIQNFDIEASRRVRHIRAKGTAAKVNFQLSAAPSFAGLPETYANSRMVIAPSSADVERAFNPVKYGEVPDTPTLELVLQDPAEGQTNPTLSVIAGFVPLDRKGGWTDAAREALGDTVQSVIEAYAPGFSGLVLQRDTITPADIQTRTRAPGGHWHHAEMGLDQILTVRPANGLAHYNMGVSGLYLCGSAAHPGGDISGLPGRNSALQALKDGAV